MREYPCPDCGSDGPHPIVYDDDDMQVMECNNCDRTIDVKAPE